jgi:hypothetical protein
MERLQPFGERRYDITEMLSNVSFLGQSIDGSEGPVDPLEAKIPVPHSNPIGSGLEQFVNDCQGVMGSAGG